MTLVDDDDGIVVVEMSMEDGRAPAPRSDDRRQDERS
jgi:hypothetical protein